MKPTVPKIIIKPRQAPAAQAQPVAGTSSRLITAAPSTPTPEASTPRGDDDGTEGDEAMDVDGADENPPTGDEEGGGGSRVGTPRPRGRPRGRGRGLGLSLGAGAGAGGASTPRARGRGRGRGRPRGGGRGALTIRLPKRGDEEGDEGDGEREETAEAEEGPGAQEEGEEPKPEKEKEAPLGGGKPFRKIQGKVYIIQGDEFVTDDDPKGDEKIDSSGTLLGGRRFKASTFVLPTRHPTRQYMLAIDAARTSGFRDSLYYFRRNLLAFKLNATQPEKDYLIAEGKLGSHLRTRSVTLITARSAFKLHGSKMVVDGKWVVDDYYEEKTLEEITALGLKAGDPVGELPDPNAASHGNELSQAASAAAAASGKAERGGGGGGGVYRAGGPTTIFGGSGWGPFSDGPLNAVRKSVLSRDGVAEENWMYMMASRVADAGDEWAKWRREGIKVGGGGEGLIPTVVEDFPDVVPKKKSRERGVEEYEEEEEEEDEEDEEGVELVEPVSKRRRVGFKGDELPLGVYEAHTGVVHYRADTQPTQSRWEALPNPDKRVLGGSKAGNGAWALAWIDTVVELPHPGGSPAAKAREKLLKEVAESPVVDLTVDS